MVPAAACLRPWLVELRQIAEWGSQFAILLFLGASRLRDSEIRLVCCSGLPARAAIRLGPRPGLPVFTVIMMLKQLSGRPGPQRLGGESGPPSHGVRCDARLGCQKRPGSLWRRPGTVAALQVIPHISCSESESRVPTDASPGAAASVARA